MAELPIAEIVVTKIFVITMVGAGLFIGAVFIFIL